MAAVLLLAAGCEQNKESAKTAQSTETVQEIIATRSDAEKSYFSTCMETAAGSDKISPAKMEKYCLCTLDAIKENSLDMDVIMGCM